MSWGQGVYTIVVVVRHVAFDYEGGPEIVHVIELMNWVVRLVVPFNFGVLGIKLLVVHSSKLYKKSVVFKSSFG